MHLCYPVHSSIRTLGPSDLVVKISALDPKVTLQRFDVKLVSVSMIFKITKCTSVSKAKFNIQFCLANQVLKFSKKCQNFRNITTYAKKDNFWNQILKNSRTQGNFENCMPPTPTSHQLLKPSRLMVNFFKNIYKYNLFTCSIYVKKYEEN